MVFLFLCSDRLLRDTAAKRLSNDKRFSCLESLDDFSSYLKLADERLTSSFTREILNRAAAKFYSRGDPGCLYLREALPDRITSEFKMMFENPTKSDGSSFSLSSTWPSNAWQPGNDGRFWIKAARFISLVRPREYHWSSMLTFIQTYLRSRSPFAQFALQGSPPAHEARVLFLPFNVSWKASVKADGRFQNLAITEIKLRGNVFRDATDEEKKRYGLLSEPLKVPDYSAGENLRPQEP